MVSLLLVLVADQGHPTFEHNLRGQGEETGVLLKRLSNIKYLALQG